MSHQGIYFGLVQSQALRQQGLGDLLACVADDIQNVLPDGVVVARHRGQDAFAAVGCLPVLCESGALQVLRQRYQGRQWLLILQIDSRI